MRPSTQASDARRQFLMPCGCTSLVTGSGGSACGHGRSEPLWSAFATGAHASMAAPTATQVSTLLAQIGTRPPVPLSTCPLVVMSEPRQTDGTRRAIMVSVETDFDRRYRACQSRDARFDGAFYCAVTSTGIYCRPSCPAITPKRANV